jgi:hypothetical protein
MLLLVTRYDELCRFSPYLGKQGVVDQQLYACFANRTRRYANAILRMGEIVLNGFDVGIYWQVGRQAKQQFLVDGDQLPVTVSGVSIAENRLNSESVLRPDRGSTDCRLCQPEQVSRGALLNECQSRTAKRCRVN